jgi:hypothetical protein
MAKYLPLLALCAPFLQITLACNSHITQPPLLWLADWRASSPSNKTPVISSLSSGTRLIRFEEGAIPIPVTESEKLELEKSGLPYFDVTEHDVEAVFRENIAWKVGNNRTSKSEFKSESECLSSQLPWPSSALASRLVCAS